MMRSESERLNLNAKIIFSLLIALMCASVPVFGQQQQDVPPMELPPLETPQFTASDEAPPPTFALSNAEKTQLNGETDFKRRMQLCLELADARLQRAEEMTGGDRFQEALVELGAYQAVIENGLNFLQRQNDDSRRARDTFRRFEMTLRAHAPRLETIRRTTPFEHAVHLKAIMKFARDARTRALDSFFSDTVVVGDMGMKTQASQPEKKP